MLYLPMKSAFKLSSAQMGEEEIIKQATHCLISLNIQSYSNNDFHDGGPKGLKLTWECKGYSIAYLWMELQHIDTF